MEEIHEFTPGNPMHEGGRGEVENTRVKAQTVERERHVDPATGRSYMYNRKTKSTRWVTGADNAHGEREKHVDPATGRSYWYNRNTKSTRWAVCIVVGTSAPAVDGSR